MKKFALRFIVALLAFLIGIAVARRSHPHRYRVPEQLREDPQLQAADEGVLGYVNAAKKAGLKEVTIPGMIDEYMLQPGSIDDVRGHGTIAEARLIEQYTYNMGDTLITWNRFRTLETMSSPYKEVSFQGGLPPEIPPLNRGEFFLHTLGGVLVIDGVVAHKQPELKNGQKYLLFMNLNSSSGLGYPVTGPSGIFEVGDDGALTPLSSQTNAITAYVASLGSSHSAVRKKMKATPKQKHLN